MENNYNIFFKNIGKKHKCQRHQECHCSYQYISCLEYLFSQTFWAWISSQRISRHIQHQCAWRHTRNWIQEKEEIIERMMLGLAQFLSICSLDEAKVKDTAIKWIRGRREDVDDERWGSSVAGRGKARGESVTGVVVARRDKQICRRLTKTYISHKSNKRRNM